MYGDLVSLRSASPSHYMYVKPSGLLTLYSGVSMGPLDSSYQSIHASKPLTTSSVLVSTFFSHYRTPNVLGELCTAIPPACTLRNFHDLIRPHNWHKWRIKV